MRYLRLILVLFAFSCNVTPELGSKRETQDLATAPTSAPVSQAAALAPELPPDQVLKFKETLRDIQYTITLKPERSGDGYALRATVEVQAPEEGEAVSLSTKEENGTPIDIYGEIKKTTSDEFSATSGAGLASTYLLPPFKPGEQRTFEALYPDNKPSFMGTLTPPLMANTLLTAYIEINGVERATPAHRYRVQIAKVELRVTEKGEPLLKKLDVAPDDVFQDEEAVYRKTMSGHPVEILPWNPVYERNNFENIYIEPVSEADEPWILLLGGKPWRPQKIQLHVSSKGLVVNGAFFGKLSPQASIQIQANSVKVNGELLTGIPMTRDQLEDFFPSTVKADEVAGRKVELRSALSATSMTSSTKTVDTLCCDEHCVKISNKGELLYRLGNSDSFPEEAVPGKPKEASKPTFLSYGKVPPHATISILMNKVWVDGKLRKGRPVKP